MVDPMYSLPVEESDTSTTPDCESTLAQLSDLTVSRPLPPIPENEEEMAANNSNAFPPLDNSMNPPNRSPGASPTSQVNGNGGNYASNYIPPLPVGHQQDLAYLYQQIQELSGILESNREKVNDVTKSAEEVAVCVHTCLHVDWY